MAYCLEDHLAALLEIIIDDEGKAWITTADEIIKWMQATHPGVDDVYAVLELGFIHIWKTGRDVFVSLRPDRVNPITMTGAIGEIARLGQDWTMVSTMARCGRGQIFRGYILAVQRMTELMAEPKKLEPYLAYSGKKEITPRFTTTGKSAKS